MPVFVAIIFITGAVTLALELLASRIMTPYFGVSLYIWTGILSITLISLAFGYFFGGRLASDATQFTNYPARLRWMFLSMPAMSGISLGIACLVYPSAFFHLAQVSLVFGSFIACIILLFVPLITLSAMNPLLIALRTSDGGGQAATGDSGSGLVFFISTVGSVLGVWITAFLFIPNLTNFTSVLLLGLMLSLVSLAAGLTLDTGGGRQKSVLIAIAITGLALCGSVLAASETLLGKDGEVVSYGAVWKLEKEYMSLFGNTKVIVRSRDPASGNTRMNDVPDSVVIYYQDGIVQNVTDRAGESQTVFSFALEGLAMAFMHSGDRALVLGLGAGIVPMRLAERGIAVDVVEINPASFQIAKEFFGFDATKVNGYQQDARSFVKTCPDRYSAIVVDLFSGEGIPEYLLTKNFFADLNHCLRPDGVVVINAFAVPQYFESSYHMFRTLRSVFRHLLLFHDDFKANNDPANIYLVATNREQVGNFEVSLGHVPAHLYDNLRRVFARARPLDEAMLARATVISDEYNIFPVLNYKLLMAYKRKMLSVIPTPYLVN